MICNHTYNACIRAVLSIHNHVHVLNSPDLRLVDGSSRCHGRVEFRPTSFDAFGQVCDLNAGNSQAQVICRELGCNPTGARRVNPTKYVPRL